MGMVSSIAAGYQNGKVVIWSISGVSNAPLHQLDAHDVAVTGIAFHGKLNVLATASAGENFNEAAKHAKLRFWNASNLELRQTVSMAGGFTRSMQMLEHKPHGSQTMPCFAVASDTRQKETLKLF